jgi:hypothetical protein
MHDVEWITMLYNEWQDAVREKCMDDADYFRLRWQEAVRNQS